MYQCHIYDTSHFTGLFYSDQNFNRNWKSDNFYVLKTYITLLSTYVVLNSNICYESSCILERYYFVFYAALIENENKYNFLCLEDDNRSLDASNFLNWFLRVF